GKLQLTGDFKLNLKNALKNGETLDFNYRGLPAQSQELNLAFIYPYLFKSQLGVSTSFQLFKRDSSFLNLNTKLAFDYNFNLTKKISFFLENFNGNQVSNNQSATIPNNANINSVFYGIALAYINLDNKLIPLKGADFNLQLSAGQRKITPSQDFNPEDFFEQTKSQQFKFQADLKYYFKLGTKAVLFAHNHSAILTGKNVFENEAFRIGGFKTLRGFDEQSINVNSFSIQTTEFRYFVERNSYLNIFYDQAYIYQNFINQKSTDYPLGIGAGITFQTKIGITSLSYAIGKQKNIPLDLQRGKIHIGILSYF
ncbi:MAG TPA: ShlB/FhaC/HecB family hemolysin secretion/activation protein, partial [Pelobium sp.]|nr:ShlB/FhaC/HecB family hemolysin secretion/activation protein [Pelobium sp.]